jgi:putative oxidoreductase
MTHSRRRIVTVLAALLGLVMIAGGSLKVVGESHQVAAFASWGLPPWFRALVGTFEVLGGLLLTVPATRPVGSLILSTIMVGALWAHAAHEEWGQLVPVVVLLTLFLTIFRSNRTRAMQLLGGA